MIVLYGRSADSYDFIIYIIFLEATMHVETFKTKDQKAKRNDSGRKAGGSSMF